MSGSYPFQPYDVLQVCRGTFGIPGGIWQDFSTLRSQADADMAVGLVSSGHWEGKPCRFRIVRKFPFAVVFGG